MDQILKFGKLPPKFHPNTLRLNDFELAAPPPLPAPPEKEGWEYAVPDNVWAASMLGNDTVGDCAEAAALHYIMAATANTKKPVAFVTQDALDVYSEVTGYDPSDPSTDQGTAYTDLFAHWQKAGVKSHKILGWAAVDFKDPVALDRAIATFGAVFAGAMVTQSMIDQFKDGKPWNAPFDGDKLGGHAFPVFGYGSLGRTCLTWAKRQPSDLNLPTVFDEAYVVVTQDWLDLAGETPLGYNLSGLESALKAQAVTPDS